MPITKYLSLLALWCAFQLLSVSAQAQVIKAGEGAGSNSSISCFIVAPIGITKLQDMNFGAVISWNAGSVILSPDGNNLLTTGNVSLRSTQGNTSAASFEVNDGLNGGNPQTGDYTGYSISLPTSDITLTSQEGFTMRVSNFTSSLSSEGYSNYSNGKGLLTVGATLFVNESQEIGKYMSSTPFPVTVNFN